jgi:transcriptional regulator with XRE-family HTH domain
MVSADEAIIGAQAGRAEGPTRIGVRVEKLLREMGRNAAWLADRAGVERSTISRLLKGARTPTPETLRDIAPILGVTLSQLVVGTDAAARVGEADDLVARRDYEAAVRQVVEFERQSSELQSRVRGFTEELRSERDRRRRLAEELEERAEELASARRKADHNERDARRYREALERAVIDVARLQERVRELGVAVDSGRRTGRVAAILAGVAAAVSVAHYLRSDDAPASESTDDEPAGGDEEGTGTA